jgi:BAAT / Acyl-CoA thioester hydrolase C terminal
VFERRLDDANAIAPAVIPVERIAGPLLLVAGTDDQLWPSDRYVGLAIARRHQHAVPYTDVSLEYTGAIHFIGAPPTSRRSPTRLPPASSCGTWAAARRPTLPPTPTRGRRCSPS